MSGVPIAASMAIVGALFAWLYYGGVQFAILAGMTAWSYACSYTLTMIPLFVLMGETIGQSGVGRDSFDCLHMWLTKLKGGLAIASTITCSLFGAITGSSSATIATVGRIAVPEMKKHGYEIPLRVGSIAVAGALANLIPPSIIAIFYCVLTEVSVGKVFLAGIIPGIILTIFYSVTIYTWVSLKPSAAPISAETFPLRDRLVALKGPVPILIIFLLMVGGIYRGIFSPTEAAGIGVVYAVAMTLIMRRLTWQRFKTAVLGSVRITVFIMFLIMGAMLFANSMALSRLPDFVAETMLGLEVPPIILIFMILGIFLVFGCVLDVFGLMVLFVPLFYPTVIGIGFSPVWYGTMTVMLIEMATITPPVAAHIYIAQATDPEATAIDVIKGVLPFYFCILVLLVLVIFFPQLATWLPSMMM